MTILGKNSIGPPHYPTEKSEEKQKRGSELRRLVGYVSFFYSGRNCLSSGVGDISWKNYCKSNFQYWNQPKKKARLVLGTGPWVTGQ
jgi:hypothetical protein